MRDRAPEPPQAIDAHRSPPLKRVERQLKSAWLRVLAAAHGGSRPRSAPDWDARPYRVLLLRHDGIGDLIVSLPLVDAITRARPTITLDVLASRANASLLEGRPNVARVIVHDRGSGAKDRLRELRASRYDAVIDGRVVTQGVNPHVAKLMLATGAPYRIGLAGRHDDWFYTLPARPERPLGHVVEYMVALAAPFGIDPRAAQQRPTLALPGADRDEALSLWNAVAGDGVRLLVNLSAGNTDRRWPDDRFLAVLQRARSRHPDVAILVIGLPVDLPSAQRLASAVSGAALAPPLRSTLALIATGGMVFTPDTAVSHIASAFERPTVTMLRRGFERWVPYRTPGRNVFGDSPLTLGALPVEPVADAVLSLLDELSAPRP